MLQFFSLPRYLPRLRRFTDRAVTLLMVLTIAIWQPELLNAQGEGTVNGDGAVNSGDIGQAGDVDYSAFSFNNDYFQLYGAATHYAGDMPGNRGSSTLFDLFAPLTQDDDSL